MLGLTKTSIKSSLLKSENSKLRDVSCPEEENYCADIQIQAFKQIFSGYMSGRYYENIKQNEPMSPEEEFMPEIMNLKSVFILFREEQLIMFSYRISHKLTTLLDLSYLGIKVRDKYLLKYEYV